LSDLILQHPYPVVGAHKVKTRYGPTVMLTLRTQTEINLRIYLPKWYADCVQYDDFNDINQGRNNCKLVYLGMSGSAHILHLEQ
jgi:hypothetical protein